MFLGALLKITSKTVLESDFLGMFQVFDSVANHLLVEHLLTVYSKSCFFSGQEVCISRD